MNGLRSLLTRLGQQPIGRAVLVLSVLEPSA